METNNYVLSTLPSYVKYSRRELAKLSKENRRESAFSGIRQKLSSAVISVPYGAGLDNLRLIGNLEDHEFQNRFTSYRKPKRLKKLQNMSEKGIVERDVNMSPNRNNYPKYCEQFSPTKFTYGHKPKRIGSETSTTSTGTSKSRSTIYSTTSEHDDGHWAIKLKELDEVKERYSDNSEFLTHLYGYKHKKEKQRKKKKKRREEMAVKHEDQSSPQSIFSDISRRVVLPPIQQKHDGKSTRESTLTYPSDESNTSTVVANNENDILKKRTVEFNLRKVKRTSKLPPIESQSENVCTPRTKNPKRSILKKIDKNSEKNVHSFPANVVVTKPVWQTEVGSLKSPVPSPASRKHQVTFKRHPFNLKYKCSKEFEVVATNYDSEGKSSSFITDQN